MGDRSYSGGIYTEWQNEEFLTPLDAFIAEPTFEADKIDSNLLDAQRSGDSRIYSLAPYFSSMALYYNKDLFDLYQVEYPRDYMTWEEIFFIAAQFPEHEARGYQYIGGPTFLLLELLRTNKVEIIDQQQRINIVNNDDFKDLLHQVFLFYQKYDNYIEFALDRVSFEDGQVAMEILDVGSLERKEVDFNWNLVSVPVPHNGSKESDMLYFHDSMSIYANSPYVEEAWQIISFINGENADINYMQGDWNASIPVRRSKFASDSEKNYAHLYTMRLYSDRPDQSAESLIGFISVLYPIMDQILEKEISIEQGLIEMELEAQALLDER